MDQSRSSSQEELDETYNQISTFRTMQTTYKGSQTHQFTTYED